MCNGFGAIAIGTTEQFKLYFIEPNGYGDVHHNRIISRMAKHSICVEDFNYRLNRFVRLEEFLWKEDTHRMVKETHFDERGTLPTWAATNQHLIFDRFDKLAERVKALSAAFVDARKALKREYRAYGTMTERYSWDFTTGKGWTKKPKGERMPEDKLKEYKEKSKALKLNYIRNLSKIEGYVPV